MSVDIESSEEAGQHPQNVQDGLFVCRTGLKQEVEVANEQAAPLQSGSWLGFRHHYMSCFSFSFPGCVLVMNLRPVAPECPAAEGEG